MEKQKKPTKNHLRKRLVTLCLAMAVVLTAIPYTGAVYRNESGTGKSADAESAAAAATLSTQLANPRIVTDRNMKSGQKVTWDCVWFGSYPQAEVISTAMKENYSAIGSSCLLEDDLFVDDAVYTALQSAADWDDNGDITLNGERYRRTKKADASYSKNGKNYHYKWSDSSTYHYFKYQPIKWRVLSTDGSKTLLLADKVLDSRQYDSRGGDVTWEISTIRSWLNGYNSSSNSYTKNYGISFIDNAFTAEEQGVILDTAVVNDNHLQGNTNGGNDTTDKVFLLSQSDVYFSEAARSYGFITADADDEARQAMGSTYAKAMGAYYDNRPYWRGKCLWWLRSPGYDVAHYACCMCTFGAVSDQDVKLGDNGVRPALYINLDTASSLCSYAGCRYSDEVKYWITSSSTKEAAYIDGTSKVSGTNVNIAAVPDSVILEGETYQVTSIAKKGFYNHYTLKSVTIGSNVTAIGESAFQYCDKLKKITIQSENLQSIGKNAFKGIAKNAVIEVPEGRLKEYKKLFTAKTGYKKTMKIIEYTAAGSSEETVENEIVTETGLANPRKEKDVSMEAGLKVTWDCIWFGSYPQAEVVSTAMGENYTAINSSYLQEGDLIVDDNIYTALQNATNWDTNGDITLDGEKYRRIRKKDSLYDSDWLNSSYYTFYKWSGKNTYHYFKYQPIKWRILSIDGSKALLLSDKVLDNQKYHTAYTNTTWKTSTIRSWLNGYKASSNNQNTDYRNKNFIDSAFTSEEQDAIRDTLVVNRKDGKNTTDKLFLLSKSQTDPFKETLAEDNFGMLTFLNIGNEALCAKGSTYAKAMGIPLPADRIYAGNCLWALRPQNAYIDEAGDSSSPLPHDSYGIRVALYLSLDTASPLYSPAGIRCSDEVHYRVISASAKEAAYIGSYAEGTSIIPDTIVLEGENYQVTTIAEGAFDGFGYRIYYDDKYDYEDIGIFSVTIGSNVTTIEKNAFRKCKYLKEVTIKSENLQSIGKNAFKGIAKNAVIKVPESKLEEYKKLFTAKTGYKETMEIYTE